MKIKSLVVLMIIFAVLSAAFFMLNFITDENDNNLTTSTENVRKLIKQFNPDDITSIEFPIDGNNITLCSKSGEWIISNDEDTPINQTAVSSIISKITTILAIREIGRNSFSDYGLDSPSLTVSVTVDNEIINLIFGNEISHYNGYYFTLGDGNIYIVDDDLFNCFNIEMSELVELPKISYNNIADIVFQMYNGITIDFGNKTSVNNELKLFSAVKSIEPANFVEYGNDISKKYGLDKPATITIKYENGESIRLTIGHENDNGNMYFYVNNSHAVYLMRCSNSEILLDYINKHNNDVKN